VIDRDKLQNLGTVLSRISGGAMDASGALVFWAGMIAGLATAVGLVAYGDQTGAQANPAALGVAGGLMVVLDAGYRWRKRLSPFDARAGVFLGFVPLWITGAGFLAAAAL